MKIIVSILLIVSICLGLYITNPTRDEFQVFVEENIRSEFNKDSNSNTLTTLVSNFSASLAGKTASYMADIDDYYLFSIYSVRIFDEDFKFIGIFNKFIPLQIPEMASEEPGV